MMYLSSRMWKHVLLPSMAAVLTLLGTAVSFGQSAPSTLPDKTVWGRLGIGTGSGPGQAIPFTTLFAQSGILPAGASGTIQYNNAGALGGATGMTVVPGGPMTITTSANTANQALRTVSNGSGALGSGTFSFNTMQAFENMTFPNPGDTANTLSVLLAPATGAKGSSLAFSALVTLTQASTVTGGDLIAADLFATASAPNGGSGPSTYVGTLFGCSCVGIAASGATFYEIVTGAEMQAGILTGANAEIRFAMTIAGSGNLQGDVYDAGIGFYNYTSAGGFKFGIEFTNVIGGFQPLTTTATVFGTDGTSATVANFADFHTYTFSGNLFNFPNLVVDNTGSINLGTTATATVSTNVKVGGSNGLVLQRASGSSGNGIITNVGGAVLLGPSGGTSIELINNTATGITFNNYGAGVLTTSAGGQVSAVTGVTCSGSPTGSFASTGGVVTHC